MATFRKRKTSTGSTKWQVMVRRKGTGSVSSTFTSKTEAQKWAKKIEDEIAGGKFLPPEQRERTFADLLAEYVKQGLPTLQRRRGELAPKEREKRTAQLEWWAERFGDRLLGLINPAAVREGVAALKAGETPSGKPAGPATVNRYLAALSALFTFGMKQLDPPWVSVNPARAVGREAEPEPSRAIFRRDQDIDGGDPGEWSEIKAACRASADRRLYPALLFTAGTGCRPCELFRSPGAKTIPLRWEDLDLRTGHGGVGRSKSGFAKEFYLAGEPLEALREYAKVRPMSAEFVFENENGDATFPRRAWEKAQKAAGVSLNWYRLRHSFASWLLMDGDGEVSLAVVGEALGHRSPAMTQRYAHLVGKRKRELAALVAKGL